MRLALCHRRRFMGCCMQHLWRTLRPKLGQKSTCRLSCAPTERRTLRNLRLYGSRRGWASPHPCKTLHRKSCWACRSAGVGFQLHLRGPHTSSATCTLWWAKDAPEPRTSEDLTSQHLNVCSPATTSFFSEGLPIANNWRQRILLQCITALHWAALCRSAGSESVLWRIKTTKRCSGPSVQSLYQPLIICHNGSTLSFLLLPSNLELSTRKVLPT